MNNDNLTESKANRTEVGEVTKVLHRIKTHKATGPDGLKGIVLKECPGRLGHVCTRLIQVFLDYGFVPAAWKNTTVIPVPKSFKDFCPIALIDCIYSVQVHEAYYVKN